MNPYVTFLGGDNKRYRTYILYTKAIKKIVIMKKVHYF